MAKSKSCNHEAAALNIAAAMYLVIGLAVFMAHILAVPNVTIGLMVLRSILWPLWILTGSPHGVPLVMDCALRDCG